MAKQFLKQLLIMENSVQSDESQQCYICLSECGTLSSETGIIECQIRLPCNPNHVFGSACIATWLKSNNTCPMCRHALFSKRQETTEAEASHLTRPVRLNRNGIASNEADDGADDEAWVTFHRTQSARAARISGLVLSYSAALRLSESVIQCSQIIGEQAGDAYSLADRSDESIAAACVYLASHLRRQPIALVEASRLAFHTDCTIQTIYRRLYAYHHSMPSLLWCEFFGTSSSLAPAEDRRSANWPPLDPEYVDDDESEDEEFKNSEDEELILDIWSRFSTELHLQPAVVTMAGRILVKLETWPTFAFSNPTSLIAISIYAASCIAGNAESHVPIADVAGISAPYLASTYGEIYAEREQLLDSTMEGVVLPVPSREQRARF